MMGHAAMLPFAWNMFDVYLFDIDGTLLRCEDAVHYFAFCEALNTIAGTPISLDGVVAHGNTDIGILRDAFAIAGVPDAAWRPKLISLCESMLEFVKAREEELCAIAMPYVQETLAYLRAQGAVLGIATGNLHGIGELKLKRAGLLDYFSFGGWSDACEYRDDVYKNAVMTAKSAAGEDASICAVGDTPADIQAARHNGLSVIAVATGIYSFENLSAARPDLCLHSLGELVSSGQALPA